MFTKSEKSLKFRLSIQPWLNDLQSTALQLTLEANSAEDLLKSTLLSIYRNFDPLDSPENFRKHSFEVLFDTFNSSNNTISDTLDDIKPQDLSEFYLYNKIDESNDLRRQPTENVIRTLVPDEIDNIINNLPGYMRLVMFLKDVQDFSYEEIAHLTRTSVERVVAGICLGRKLLQRHLWSNFEKDNRASA